MNYVLNGFVLSTITIVAYSKNTVLLDIDILCSAVL